MTNEFKITPPPTPVKPLIDSVEDAITNDLNIITGGDTGNRRVGPLFVAAARNRIVDNIKVLIQKRIDANVMDIKHLCDEVVTVSEQMVELKALIDQISATKQPGTDDAYSSSESCNEQTMTHEDTVIENEDTPFVRSILLIMVAIPVAISVIYFQLGSFKVDL